eukprot:COSAG05_NODE_9841_length_598_cov_0.819639_1_plen_81_part_10
MHQSPFPSVVTDKCYLSVTLGFEAFSATSTHFIRYTFDQISTRGITIYVVGGCSMYKSTAANVICVAPRAAARQLQRKNVG